MKIKLEREHGTLSIGISLISIKDILKYILYWIDLGTLPMVFEHQWCMLMLGTFHSYAGRFLLPVSFYELILIHVKNVMLLI